MDKHWGVVFFSYLFVPLKFDNKPRILRHYLLSIYQFSVLDMNSADEGLPSSKHHMIIIAASALPGLLCAPQRKRVWFSTVHTELSNWVSFVFLRDVTVSEQNAAVAMLKKPENKPKASQTQLLQHILHGFRTGARGDQALPFHWTVLQVILCFYS